MAHSDRGAMDDLLDASVNFYWNLSGAVVLVLYIPQRGEQFNGRFIPKRKT
jgi:hypothetical protein